jgi:hypothetical protein
MGEIEFRHRSCVYYIKCNVPEESNDWIAAVNIHAGYRRLSWIVILLLTMTACADANRDNSIDPINTPVVTLATPVFDAGTILLEWQYYTEGDDLVQFEVTRTSEGVSTSLGMVPITPAGPGWQDASLRDTAFVAGVDVEYRVLALNSGGAITASSSGSIRIGGTILNLVRDAWNLQMQLTWSDEPSGTIGYEVLRNGEVIFTTNDPTVHTYDDTTVSGNTRYVYRLRTRLPGGRLIESDSNEGVLWLYEATSQRDQSTSPGSRYILPEGTSQYGALSLTSPQAYSLSYGSDPPSSTAMSISLPDSDPATWSVAELNHSNLAFRICITGLLDSGISFLNVYRSLSGEPVRTEQWPSSGGSRTGVIWAGAEASGKTVFYEGTTLRVLDDDFKVADEVQIDTGEPIDIIYQAGSIWLAYPDRLVRSNNTFLSEGFTAWETVELPLGTTVTALTRLTGPSSTPHKLALVILDGMTAKLHAMSLDGEILLTWDAQGEELVKGDVSLFTPAIGIRRILQTDGKGTLHIYRPRNVGI